MPAVLRGTLQSILGGTTESCGTGRNYSGRCLEGPEFFRYNDDDRASAQELYGLMAERYEADRGCLPFRTTDPGSTSPADWSNATDVDFGVLKKCHGTILPITQREYERVGDAAADVVVSTGCGTKALAAAAAGAPAARLPRRGGPCRRNLRVMFPLPKSGSVGWGSRAAPYAAPRLAKRTDPMEKSPLEDVRGEHER
ncbi:MULTISPECIES: hypothetical protein [Glycomyces]|uniref:Uncharacterized protein n=2 Tax=Glycomyces TaxID=58113 RepID=A0A9X3PMQ3_9ACTN|nr:hypothetical protein [Glycomyces lechevalierae]MDA1385747.1 hypothetical protein [Glycomyces lechevalierae]MDR7339867.1 hypothetical protein [Glycomyces lechevalierae]